MCCSVLQTTGGGALYFASQNGRVECVWVLLEAGAAIDQAEVGFAHAMGGTVKGSRGRIACVRVL